MTETEFAVLEGRLAHEGVSLREQIGDDLTDQKRLNEIDTYEKLVLWVASINAKVNRLMDQKQPPQPQAQPPKIVSPYLTAEEAAAYLRLDSVKKIYGLIERGKLRPLPGSRKLRFTIEILDEYLRGEQ
jgi:excisionase family DNA binding protein